MSFVHSRLGPRHRQRLQVGPELHGKPIGEQVHVPLPEVRHHRCVPQHPEPADLIALHPEDLAVHVAGLVAEQVHRERGNVGGVPVGPRGQVTSHRITESLGQLAGVAVIPVDMRVAALGTMQLVLIREPSPGRSRCSR